MGFALMVAIALGILIGYVATSIIKPKEKVIGTLNVIYEDDQPNLYLGLDDEVESIVGENYVTMKVHIERRLSQK